MTAKDTANELVDRFKSVTRPFSKRSTLKVYVHPEHAKQCALICVDEILELPLHLYGLDYWTRVKQEIEKL